MFAFCWVYPHFLETSSILPYLYSAPIGLIPCPTFITVIGFALVFNRLDSRALSLLSGIPGIYYGTTGVIQLGVVIDTVLLVGVLLIVISAFTMKRRRPRGRIPGNSRHWPGIQAGEALWRFRISGFIPSSRRPIRIKPISIISLADWEESAPAMKAGMETCPTALITWPSSSPSTRLPMGSIYLPWPNISQAITGKKRDSARPRRAEDTSTHLCGSLRRERVRIKKRHEAWSGSERIQSP